MKHLIAIAACTGLVCALPAHAGNAKFSYYAYAGKSQESALSKPGPGQYVNPVVSGYAPDPSITRVGDDYYLVTSSFVHYPGLPIYHSRDLVTWTQIGNAIDRPGQVDFSGMKVSAGLMAPSISYHDGVFYIVCTNRKNFIITAKDPAGPWSDPVEFDFDGIDPALFWDENGKAYIVNNGAPKGGAQYPGHRAIWLQEFDPAGKAMTGPRWQIIDGGADLSTKPFWTEAPHLYKKDGYYYLIDAQGGTGEQHSEVVFRSRAITGPYESYAGNPILTQRDLPEDRPHAVGTAGHAEFVQTPDGQWWSVFLATRNYGPDLYNIGRETFLLPVTWKGGWPHILEHGKTVPFVVDRPNLPPAPRPAQPLSGDYAYRDDFTGPKLGLGWMSVRIPATAPYSLERGDLVLTASPEGLGDIHHVPAFVGRKQAHAIATVSTEMRYTAEGPGDRAGLVAMQSDDAYLFFGVQRKGGGQAVTLSVRKNGKDPQAGRVLASVALPRQAGRAARPVYLKLSIDGGVLAASYAVRRNAWHKLATGVDATFLSTRHAGGFVGTVIGLYNELGTRATSAAASGAIQN
jgi:xylan 1,4-beta-xylosidase